MLIQLNKSKFNDQRKLELIVIENQLKKVELIDRFKLSRDQGFTIGRNTYHHSMVTSRLSLVVLYSTLETVNTLAKVVDLPCILEADVSQVAIDLPLMVTCN